MLRAALAFAKLIYFTLPAFTIITYYCAHADYRRLSAIDADKCRFIFMRLIFASASTVLRRLRHGISGA